MFSLHLLLRAFCVKPTTNDSSFAACLPFLLVRQGYRLIRTRERGAAKVRNALQTSCYLTEDDPSPRAKSSPVCQFFLGDGGQTAVRRAPSTAARDVRSSCQRVQCAPFFIERLAKRELRAVRRFGSSLRVICKISWTQKGVNSGRSRHPSPIPP